jgi:hypothetical protein
LFAGLLVGLFGCILVRLFAGLLVVAGSAAAEQQDQGRTQESAWCRHNLTPDWDEEAHR